MTDISLKEIKTAYENIRNHIRLTPVVPSFFHSKKHQANIALKLENLNITGSFKIRGAFNAVINADKQLSANGIVAASAGNHAQGVAFACREFKIPSTIFMPEGTPLVKTARTRALGAEIVLQGETYDDAEAAARELQQKKQMLMIHPFADAKVVNGQGSMGLELLEQVKDLGLIVVPIGGGGMISGIACAVKNLKPDVKIIGVQTDSYPAMKESFYEGKIVKTERRPTIADGIAVKSVSEMNLNLIKKYVDKIVTVSEDDVAQGIMELMEYNRVVAEGAAASSIASLHKLEDDIKECAQADKSIVCLIGGGNIDVTLLSKITTRGLIHSGRLMRLHVAVKDRPGGLSDLLSLVAKCDANIQQVKHERTFGTKHFKDVEVHLELEVTDTSHQDKVREALLEAGYSLLSLS